METNVRGNRAHPFRRTLPPLSPPPPFFLHTHTHNHARPHLHPPPRRAPDRAHRRRGSRRAQRERRVWPAGGCCRRCAGMWEEGLWIRRQHSQTRDGGVGAPTGRGGGRQPPAPNKQTRPVRVGGQPPRLVEATARPGCQPACGGSQAHTLTTTHTHTHTHLQAFSPAPAFAKASATAQAAYADSLAAALQARGAALPEIKVAPAVSVVVCGREIGKERERDRSRRENHPTSRPHSPALASPPPSLPPLPTAQKVHPERSRRRARRARPPRPRQSGRLRQI